jgi:hypothetical protein
VAPAISCPFQHHVFDFEFHVVLYIHALPYGLEVRRDFERTAMSGDMVLQDEEDAKATMHGGGASKDDALWMGHGSEIT